MSRAVRVFAPLVVAVLGVAGIAFGLYRGEMATVLKKAIVVCLECIGIG